MGNKTTYFDRPLDGTVEIDEAFVDGKIKIDIQIKRYENHKERQMIFQQIKKSFLPSRSMIYVE